MAQTNLKWFGTTSPGVSIAVILLVWSLLGHAFQVAAVAQEAGDRVAQARSEAEYADFLANLYRALESTVDTTRSNQARASALKYLISALDSAILARAADSLDLTNEDRDRAFKSLQSKSDDLVKPYLHLAGYGSAEVIGGYYTTEYHYSTPGAMREMFGIAAMGACDVLAHLLFEGRAGPAAAVLERTAGSGCAWLLTRILDPLARALDDFGFIQDQVRLVVEHKPDIRRAILEMAVVELTANRSFSYTYRRLVLSSAELDLQVTGIIKAGYDLGSGFQLSVNPNTHTISILLPEPTILSEQFLPHISRMEQGFIAEVGNKQLNQAIDSARILILREALDGGILEQAKLRAKDAIEQLMWPFRADPRHPYAIEIMIGNNRQTHFRLEQLAPLQIAHAFEAVTLPVPSRIESAFVVGMDEFAGDYLVKQVLDSDNDGLPEAVLTWTPYGGNMATFDKLYRFQSDSLYPVDGLKGNEIRIEERGNAISSEDLWLDEDPRCCPSKIAVYTYKYSAGVVTLVGTDTLRSLRYQR